MTPEALALGGAALLLVVLGLLAMRARSRDRPAAAGLSAGLLAMVLLGVSVLASWSPDCVTSPCPGVRGIVSPRLAESLAGAGLLALVVGAANAHATGRRIRR